MQIYNNNNNNNNNNNYYYYITSHYTMNKFASTLAIVIAFTTIITNTYALRGSTSQEVQQQQRNLPRRHLLEDESECTLYLKMISYNDGTDDSESWSCEVSRALAQEQFNGRDIMNIIGISKEDIDSLYPISGESIMRTTGSYVEQYLDSAGAASNGGEDIKLAVTAYPSDIIIESITEDDARHHRYHKKRRRQLSKINTGVINTLVVRPIAPNGNVVDASADQLRSDVFEDEVCLKNQMEACSFNQLEIRPAADGNGGVVDVNIDINPIEDDTRNGNRGQLAENAVLKTDQLYGGQDGLASKYDLVIFCQPPGSGRWDAFAYLNRYDSYYNKNRCSVSGVLMHEVGHNFGLSHSGKGGGDVYGDITGYMGAGSTEDDGPKNCFNAVKNYRLGWYDLQLGSTNPLDYTGNQKSFVLNGVADYKKDGSSDGELISLRLEQFGDDDGVDFYLGYNRKAGVNSGVSQGADQVILYSKDQGLNSALSTRIVMLDIGESYTIDDYRGNGSTVTIKFDKISNSMKDATITLSSTPPPPTAAPTISCGGFGRFKVEIGIDNFAGETYWQLFEKDTNNLVEEGMDKTDYRPNKSKFEPTDGTAFCLDPGSCYDFKIYDDYGDGLKSEQGGFYRGFVGAASGGEQYTKIFEGAEFVSEDKRSFCVNDITAGTPTYSPTKAPTNDEKNCTDDPDFKFQGVKSCAMGWISQDLEKRCNTNAKESLYPNKLIKDYCPVTCGSCDSGTSPPTTSPTVSIDKGDCTDDPDFKFQGVKSCAMGWISQDLEKRCNTNAKESLYPNKLIKDYCPVTCGSCDSDTSPPTTSPTVAPTTSPTVSIDKGDCTDDPDFKFQGVKSCAMGWISQDLEKRCNKNAEELLYPNKLIKDYCKVLCNVCDPSNDNNDYDSCAINETPFKLELGIDNYGKEISWKIVEDSKGVEFFSGSKDQYMKQTEYVESYCLPNGASYSFTIYDIFGDGLKPNENGYYHGYLNNELQFEGNTFKNEETTTFTTNPNPSSPSNFCEDDPNFRFKKKKKKNCKWLGRNKKKGKRRCKKTKQGGSKLHKLCPYTCGLKFGIGQCKDLKNN